MGATHSTYPNYQDSENSAAHGSTQPAPSDEASMASITL
jgi:hypothetical protein